MKKSSIKKIFKLIGEEDASSLTIEDAEKKSKISHNEILQIFNFLIDNELVIDCSSKDGKCIMKRSDVDYNDPSILNINFLTTTNSASNLKKLIIGILITVIGGLILYFIIEKFIT